MTVRRRAAAAAAVLLVLLTACSDAGDADPTAEATVLPGTGDDFVGARQDVGAVDCRRDGGSWRASGTVSNPTRLPADYRVYVSFVDAAGTTLALRQVDVPEAAPGVATPWQAVADVAGDGLQCVLRVERVVG